MSDTLKAVGGIIFGVVLFLVIPIFLLIMFFAGALWATAHLLLPLITIAWIVLALDILIFLPLSMVRSLRSWMGTFIFLSSFLFGIVLWLSSFITTLGAWVIGGVIVGLLFAGVGVVPMAGFILLIHGQWADLGTFIGMVVATLGARLGGFALVESGSSASNQSFNDFDSEPPPPPGPPEPGYVPPQIPVRRVTSDED